MRLFYSNLSFAKNDDRLFQSAIKLARRTPEDFALPVVEERKMRPKYGKSYFSGLSRLPRKIFVLQAQKLYEDWLKQNPITVGEEKLQFTKPWIKGWEEEYEVSLKVVNKPYSLSREQCIWVGDYLKNIWSV